MTDIPQPATGPGHVSIQTTQDGRPWLTVSKSWLETFNLCPEQARHRLYGDPPNMANDASVFGVAAHAAIERTLQLTAQTGDPAHIHAQAGYEAGADDWTTNSKTIALTDRIPSVQHGLDALAGVMTKWVRHVAPELNPDVDAWQIEQTKRSTLVDNPEMRIDLYGTPDLYDGMSVWDWKTGQVIPKWKADRYDSQSTIYNHLVNGGGGGRVVLAFIPREHPAQVELIRFDRHAGHVTALIDQLEAIVHLIGAGLPVWPLRPVDWHCSERWCPAFAAGQCRGAHLEIFPTERIS